MGRTGGGGLHLRFKHPGGHVPCSSNKIALTGSTCVPTMGTCSSLTSGHISGGVYEDLNDLDPVELPGWLLELLQGEEEPGRFLPPAERGYYPAANAETLTDAARALDRFRARN
jgi:hypothetical protein